MHSLKCSIALSRDVFNVFCTQIRQKHVIHRKPLKKFVPSTKVSQKQKQTLTESDFEASEEIEDDMLDENRKKFQRIVAPIEDENLKEDYLPEGFSLNDFPKFSKVLGSDKKNPILK